MPRLFPSSLFASSRTELPAWVGPRLLAPVLEDDVPLGLECAHPVLQIDRWLSDAPETEPPRPR
jgi:hypothetical protein